MKLTFTTIAAVVLALLAPVSAQAHADLILQIDDITKLIEKSPTNAELYLKRGELRRAHVEWDAAFQDFERARQLDPALLFVDLAEGRLFHDADWPLSSRAYLDRFLSRRPNQVEALALRAHALTKLNLRLEAARDLDRAIANSPEPGPELFIERAQVLAAEGGGYFARALDGLDEGIQKLGQLVTLQLTAIDLELKQRSYDGALARLDKIAERSPRKETWLARRGEILLQAGRTEESRQAYQAALAAIATLPPARRNVPAMLELQKRIQQQLNESAPPGAK